MEYTKQSALADLKALHGSRKSELTQGASVLDVIGFARKAERATRVISKTASEADVEMVRLEAEHRGLDETVEELAAKQAAKAKLLEEMSVSLDGWYKKATDKVHSSDLEDYDELFKKLISTAPKL